MVAKMNLMDQIHRFVLTTPLAPPMPAKPVPPPVPLAPPPVHPVWGDLFLSPKNANRLNHPFLGCFLPPNCTDLGRQGQKSLVLAQSPRTAHIQKRGRKNLGSMVSHILFHFIPILTSQISQLSNISLTMFSIFSRHANFFCKPAGSFFDFFFSRNSDFRIIQDPRPRVVRSCP